jgi:hypothetical protein
MANFGSVSLVSPPPSRLTSPLITCALHVLNSSLSSVVNKPGKFLKPRRTSIRLASRMNFTHGVDCVEK